MWWKRGKLTDIRPIEEKETTTKESPRIFLLLMGWKLKRQEKKRRIRRSYKYWLQEDEQKKQGKTNKEEAMWRKLSNQKNYNTNKEKDEEIEVNERRTRRTRRRNSTKSLKKII